MITQHNHELNNTTVTDESNYIQYVSDATDRLIYNNKHSLYFRNKYQKYFRKKRSYPIINEKYGNRLVIDLNNEQNLIATDSSQGIKAIKLIKLEPLGNLDFRKRPSLHLYIEKDNKVVIDKSISEFMADQKKRYKVALINEQFSNFNYLIIKVYSKTGLLTYNVRATLMVF